MVTVGDGGERGGAELLERDGELELIAAALADARSGRGRLVLVEGEAGAGKSRLLEAGRELARAAGMRTLAARGVEQEGEIPFGVTLQLFEGAVAAASASTRKRLLEGAGALAAPLFGHGPPAGEPQAIVHGLYWVAVGLTGALGRGLEPAPLLLALDDAQWADESSLRFVAHLAARLDGLMVALVVAIRSGEPAAAEGALDAIRRRTDGVRLRPRPLSERGVGRLARETLPGAQAPFVQACAHATRGNPFYLHELLRSLRAEGLAPTAENAPAVEQLVPTSVLHSVLARLARLPDAVGRLATAVAVLGDGASLPNAAALADLERVEAERAADALARAHILCAGWPLRFSHPLVAAAVYADLPAFARAAAHRRAAALLDRSGATAHVVAHHLLRAGPDESPRAVEVLRDAAARSLSLGEPVAAARLLTRALSEPPRPERRHEVLAELATAEAVTGDTAADGRLSEALAVTQDPAARRRLLRMLGQVRASLGNREGAARALDAALDLCEAGDSGSDGVLAAYLSVCTLHPPLRAEGDKRARPLLSAARSGRLPEHPGLLAHVTLRLALAGDDPARVREVAARAVARDPLVDGSTHGALLGIVVQALVMVDELDAATATADAAILSARRRGALVAYATASCHRGFGRYHGGALDDALADLEQASLALSEGWAGGAPWVDALTAELQIARGELTPAEESVRRALSAPPSLARPLALLARAKLALLARDPRDALDASQAAARDLAAYGMDHPGLAPWRLTAAMAADRLGDSTMARRLATEAVAQAQAIGVPRAIGAALRTAAVVDGDQRIERLRQAAAALEDSTSRLERARVLADLGATLRRAGHRTECRPPLQQAIELADTMRAQPLAEEARAELRASGARLRRDRFTGAHALTPTERRVASLAADGLTNPEIAQTLFVTLKTVETHLGRAYRKLSIRTRRELPAALLGNPARNDEQPHDG